MNRTIFSIYCVYHCWKDRIFIMFKDPAISSEILKSTFKVRIINNRFEFPAHTNKFNQLLIKNQLKYRFEEFWNTFREQIWNFKFTKTNLMRYAYFSIWFDSKNDDKYVSKEKNLWCQYEILKIRSKRKFFGEQYPFEFVRATKEF